MPKFAQSCNQVPKEKVIGRIAAYRKWAGTLQPTSAPGVCQICGHPTRLKYRISRIGDDGQISRADIRTDDQADVLEFETMREQGLLPSGTMVFSVHVCEAAEDEDAWRAAKGIAEPEAEKNEPVETQTEF